MAPTTQPSSSPISAEEFMGRFDIIFGGPDRPAPVATPRGKENVAAKITTTAVLSPSSVPPPYGTPDCPAPAYNELQEPATLSQALFKYGFFFPPFWVIGAIVLFTRLDPLPEAECGKTAAEQADELALLRRAEVRWSKRCLIALVVLFVLIAIIIISLWRAHVGVFKVHHRQ